MKTRIRTIGVLFVLLVFGANVASAFTDGDWAPDWGDMYYDGLEFTDYYIGWNDVQGPSDDWTYEHDLAVYEDSTGWYASGCTSWSNLPEAYDDCPTAGVSESEGVIVLSFGSFAGEKIPDYSSYYGWINLSRDSTYASAASWNLGAQQGDWMYCWWDSIWCIGSEAGQHLMSGEFTLYQSFLKDWQL